MHLFFSTESAPCPYLPGRLERRLVAALAGNDPDLLHDRLLRAGFRRSQGYAYRPACAGCQACVPVRIPVAQFVFRRPWRRILRDNADLVASERRAVATPEQYALFRRYLDRRHATSGMAEMTWPEFQAMIDDSPIDTRLIEWRRPDRNLIAASLTDCARSGLSGVYKFFDPDEAHRSLGSLIILWHVQHAAELGLPYVYLGYWIAGSQKMAYKARFQPLEQLTPGGWQPMSAEQARAAETADQQPGAAELQPDLPSGGAGT
jgi:arginyl-tRNA--protein-N-Asp/Glu arginylyltransferase